MHHAKKIVPLFCAVALALGFGTDAARGQPMVAGEHFAAKIDTPWNYAGSTGAESAWRYELHHPDATYIAVHFTDFDLAPGDRLVITDPLGGQAYTLRRKGKMGAEKFWAQHIKGDTAVLELITTNPRGGQGFHIDEYVAGFVDLGGSVIEAICGADDKENAICYQSSHPTEYARGRAVARLLINGASLCTGSLVSSNSHLLTNEHCITSASDALNTDYEFMSEAPTCGSSNCQLCYPGTVFSGGTFIQDNASLDYCLVQINTGDPASTYGYLEIDNRTAVPGEEIYIPQHPGGRAKEFGIFSSDASDTGGICRVYSITEPPCSGTGFNDVGYFCDTEGGSSGSPVLARSSHQIIALHHCATCPNRGVPITLVYAEIADFIISSGLKVTPGDGLSSAGDAGGPFTPSSKVYTLENLNTTSLDYSISNTQAWVSLDNTGGTLAGGGTATVAVSINANANGLAEGGYSDTVTFTNLTDGDGNTTRPVDLTVGIPSVRYQWNMDTDPGWTTEGLWAYGSPTGGGGQYGNPDPTSGATGANVYGYNLAGDYENSLPERNLTSGAIDCTGLTSVSVRFQRYLNVEQPAYDHAYVRVSNDGTNWTTVWTNGAEITDAAWTQVEYDISAVADDQPTVYLRWTQGTTDGSWQYSGWNIDDVQILALGGGGCTVDGDCDDGQYCNGAETCVAQVCQPGTPVVCDDGVPCTDDTCNETTDSCDYTPNDANCANGLYCDGVETCDPVLDCLSGTPVDCDDGVACTIDSCNETTDACDNTPDDAACDDGLFCNGAETCDAGAGCLVGTDPCPGQDCDEVNDVCVPLPCNTNGTCDVGEDCNTCPSDCISGTSTGAVCGNGLCEAGDGEDCVSCPADCNGVQGGKPTNRFCCGDGDGQNPLTCADPLCSTGGWFCTDVPTGGGSPYCCGDAVCEGDEDSCNCAIDCGAALAEICANGVDDDCDGLIDCADTADCSADPACACGATGTPCTSNADCCASCNKKTGTCR